MNLDDPKLTAYALGELETLDAAELAEVETWLAVSEEGRQFVAETREMSALLTEKMHVASAPTLTDEQRDAILGKSPLSKQRDEDVSGTSGNGDVAATSKIRRVSFVASLTALAACLAAGPFLPWGEILRLQNQRQPEVAVNLEPTFQVQMAPERQQMPAAGDPQPLEALQFDEGKAKLALTTQASSPEITLAAQSVADAPVEKEAPALLLAEADHFRDEKKMEIAGEPLAISAAPPEAGKPFDLSNVLPSTDQLQTLLAEAEKFFAVGRYDLALIRWKQILQLDPKNAVALAGLAKYEKVRAAESVALLATVGKKLDDQSEAYRKAARHTSAMSAPASAPATISATPAGQGQFLAGGVATTSMAGAYYANSEGVDEELRRDKDVSKRSEPGNTEAYDSITENSFLAVKENPLSTFSIDVDTASYANLRRFINQGQLPPRGAMRIEEMLNYFSYDYPAPTGDTPFSTNFEVSECPWQPEHRLVRIGLRGRDIAASQRPAGNLVFLIDVSGSMQPQNKLPLLKQSLRLLVDQLGPQDQVAIAVYAGSSGLVLPSTSDKERIRAALDNLEAGGSTNGASGIHLAYQEAAKSFIKGGVNRVILATDGDFNVGVTSQSALVDLITEKAKSGVFLSVLGFGDGNLKDSTMEKLADKGNGNYAYIDSLNEGRKVLVEQVGGTLVTIAKDVKLQVEFNPAIVSAYRLIGYENRLLRKEDFNDDKKDAGEIGANHTVTALYEVVPVGSLAPVGEVEPLKYINNSIQMVGWPTSEMLTLKLRYKQPDSEVSTKIEFPLIDQGGRLDRASVDFRFAAAVAEIGLLLRQSEHQELAGWDAAIELAAHALGNDRNGYRAEFVQLMRKARALTNREG